MTGPAPHQCKVGIAICTPIPLVRSPDGSLVKEKVTIDWHRHRSSLGVPTNIHLLELLIDGREVGEARNTAVQRCFDQPRVPEFIFFLDYDVLPPHDTLQRLLYRARHYKDCSIFAGLYCSKSSLPEPLIYLENGSGPYWDFTLGDLLFNIKSCHMGCTLIRMELFQKLKRSHDNPWFKTLNEAEISDGLFKTNRGTEDIHFCNRAVEEAGAKLLIDTGIYCGHQDYNTGKIYGLLAESGPVKRARWHSANKNGQPKKPTKIALDLGAGGTRREWDGYETSTLDIRDDVGADYVQDVRQLNMPDEEFDLVASSHFMEHLGRWDQEKAWSEIFRILKPGGKIEFIVPNVQWAAEHIVDGHCDEHVQNVLYGAQEAHGYERIYNTHFFGYTPDVALALAAATGFVSVKIRTWKDDPDLGFEMIIKATKPRKKKAATKKRG